MRITVLFSNYAELFPKPKENHAGKSKAPDTDLRGAPGKSGLHASGEGERVTAPEPW